MSSREVWAVSVKGYLGDTVMALPLLEALSARLPVTVFGPPVVGEVLGADWSSSFVPLNRPRGIKSLREQVAAFRKHKPRVAILVNRSFRSALAAKLAGIPVRVGHATEGRGILLSKSLSYDPTKSEVESYLDLLGIAGFRVSPAIPRIKVMEQESTAGRKLLNGATIGLQPGSRYAAKQIPLPLLVELAERLHSEGFKIALLGGADERAAGEAFANELSFKPVNLVSKCSIRETLGVISQLDLMVGSDTGLMHLAASTGRPTVTVFGPNPASKWGHFNEPHQVVEAPNGLIGNLESASLHAAIDRVLGRAAHDPSPSVVVISR